jgi:hypothetical protein
MQEGGSEGILGCGTQTTDGWMRDTSNAALYRVHPHTSITQTSFGQPGRKAGGRADVGTSALQCCILSLPKTIYYTLIYTKPHYNTNLLLLNNLLLRIVTPQFPQMLHIHQYERAQFLKIRFLLFHSWLYVARPSDWRLVWYFCIS